MKFKGFMKVLRLYYSLVNEKTSCPISVLICKYNISNILIELVILVYNIYIYK